MKKEIVLDHHEIAKALASVYGCKSFDVAVYAKPNNQDGHRIIYEPVARICIIQEDETINIEKEERCEYCREKLTGYQNSDLCDIPINLFNGRSLGRMTLYINEKDRLSMDLYNSYDDPLITSDIGIHYCPMCGRRIN